MIDLTRTLLRAITEPTGTNWCRDARAIVSQASQRDWSKTLDTLRLHRITPMIAWALTEHGLTDHLPNQVLVTMRHDYRDSLLANSVRLHLLPKILEALRARSVEPIVWKGIVLVDSFYPDLGMRSMSDIDLVVEPEARVAAGQALASLGFRKCDETSDAAMYVDGNGIGLDLHHRVRLFEDQPVSNLTRDIVPQRIRTSSIRILAAHAMLIHLAHHLQGHRATRGCLLRWIVDFAFTIRALDEELSLDDLLATASATTDLVTLFRALGFLQYELNIAPPAELAPAIEFIEPFRLSEVLRSRRLMPWAVRRPRGWLRLLAGAARLRSVPAGYSLPHLDDMLRRPLDVVRERRANHRAIKTLQRLDGS